VLVPDPDPSDMFDGVGGHEKLSVKEESGNGGEMDDNTRDDGDSGGDGVEGLGTD
jgi:hypothetical protein